MIRQRVAVGSGILKCHGAARRVVTAHNPDAISMRTGATTKQTKAISYDMLRCAFEVLESRGRFDSGDFGAAFGPEQRAAPCRYSMTGGVLVEAGLADRVSVSRTDCYYVKRARGPAA